jgi:SAM-dependent methyltransferase
MPPRPHNIALYEAAVQHPLAEVRFLDRAFRHDHQQSPLLLREDFAGTCAVAAAWCESHPDRQAMAVEAHGPTLRRALRAHQHVADLHGVEADVMEVTTPRVDIVAALNFSAFIYHQRASMLAYLKHARRCLRKPGLLVLDAFGGPGAMRVGTQSRDVEPDDPALGRFTYHWEQRRYDAATGRIDCRIHFTDPQGRPRRNAFRYDWRLWSLPELVELLDAAGFTRPEIWCDRLNPATGLSDGRFRPRRTLANREDWVAYLVASHA